MLESDKLLYYSICCDIIYEEFNDSLILDKIEDVYEFTDKNYYSLKYQKLLKLKLRCFKAYGKFILTFFIEHLINNEKVKTDLYTTNILIEKDTDIQSIEIKKILYNVLELVDDILVETPNEDT